MQMQLNFWVHLSKCVLLLFFNLVFLFSLFYFHEKNVHEEAEGFSECCYNGVWDLLANDCLVRSRAHAGLTHLADLVWVRTITREGGRKPWSRRFFSLQLSLDEVDSPDLIWAPTTEPLKANRKWSQLRLELMQGLRSERFFNNKDGLQMANQLIGLCGV